MLAPLTSRAGGHPLDPARAQPALRCVHARMRCQTNGPGRTHGPGRAGRTYLVAGVVLVVEAAFQDVGDGLEAAVRVVGRADGLAGAVSGRAHVVEHEERVEHAHLRRADGAADDEPAALPLLASGEEAAHGAEPGTSNERTGKRVRTPLSAFVMRTRAPGVASPLTPRLKCARLCSPPEPRISSHLRALSS